MATSTPNLNLILPDYSDKADISVLNDNFQKIDEYCANGGVSNEELQEAVKAANSWANATASAESVSADKEADVNLTEGDNSKNLHFRIPRGQPGVLISETEPTDPNVKVWIKPDGEPNELEQLKIDVSSLKDTNAELKDILRVDDTITLPFEIAGTGFINESGKIASSEAASHTGYIDISAYERIIFRQAGTTATKSYWFYEFYDADKTRILNVRLPAKQTNPGYVEGLKEVETNGAYYARFTTIADAETYGAFEIYGVNPIKNAISNTVDEVAVLNATMSMYDSFAVCGASFDCGYYYVGGTTYVKNNLSWGANLARRNGNTFKCFARQSLYTRTWLASNYGMSALLAADPCDLYILTFGGNDSTQGDSYLGSIADITGNASYADYPDTFYGNYGKIVEQIKAHAPNALILSIMEYDNSRHSTTRKAYYEAVAEIAAHYGHPAMNWAEDRWYESEFIRSNLVSDHPTPVQLSGISCAWERLYSKCVADNYDYFKVYNP